MKKCYDNPEINVLKMDTEKVLTSSAVDMTKKSMESRELQVNGTALSAEDRIVSIMF